MDIIDAHLHMRQHENFDNLCRASGHENSLAHVQQSFDSLHVRGCVVMGSAFPADDPTQPGLFDLGIPVDIEHYNYPRGIGFCIGIVPEGLTAPLRERTLAHYEHAAACPACVGFKIYLGYHHFYADDPIYHPVYELALRLGLPVVFHTGDTASSTGRLRFSHPLTVDEVAVRYPSLCIVLAHFGNPWMAEAAEVAKKNHNVYVDLSGLAVGVPDVPDFRRRYAGYIGLLETWLGYLDRYDHVLYGTDWPLVNMAIYQALISSLIPEEKQECVFYQNALTVFERLRPLLR
ncbi:MAG: amidohydrolase family protein [Oscillospiraceae bacterium]